MKRKTTSELCFGRIRASAAKPINIGFLLTESFTLLAFSSALETLRLTNDLTRSNIYSLGLFIRGAAKTCAALRVSRSACRDRLRRRAHATC